MRAIYLALAVIGAVAPYVFFLQFFASEPFTAFIPALFVNGAAGGFTADLLIASLTFWIAMFAQQAKGRGPAPWIFIVLNLTIGLSCALPAYLWATTPKE